MEQKLRAFRFTLMKPGSLTPGSNQTTSRAIVRLVFLLIITTSVLAGCGGGGGSGGTTSSAPVAQAGSLTTTEDTASNSTLVATDVDSATLSYSIVTPPSMGTLTSFDPNTGNYTFKPIQNANGSDSFTFKANDGSLDSNIATVTVTITPINDAPVVQAGSLTTNEDAQANNILVATDMDGPNPLTYSIQNQGNKGTAVITNTATGAYTYTPNLNANGSDSFTFKANDGSLDSKIGTITVTITPINDAPVAQVGTLTTDEDIAGSGTLVATDVDSATLSYSIVTPPSMGTLTSFDPNTGNYTFKPIQNANGSDSFTFKANDGSLDSNIATVTVTITPINDAPVAQNGTLTTDENTVGNGTLVAIDPDGPSLSYSITNDVPPTKGTVLVINGATGAYTYTPNVGATGSDSFSFKAIDGFSTSNIATISVTINVVNKVPIAVVDSFTVDEGSTTTLDLAANDSDPDGVLDLDLTSIVASVPGNGSLVVNTDGTVDYTHDGSETLADSFTYTIKDQAGATSNIVAVSLTITPVNDAPIAVADNFTVDEGSTTTLNLAANDSDADDGLDLTSIVASVPGNGSLIVNANGTVDYSHDGSETTSDSFTYTIDDVAGATSNTVAVNLTITPVNDPPVATNTCVTTPQEIVTFSGTLSANDPDSTPTYLLGAGGTGGMTTTSTKGVTVTLLNTNTGAFSYPIATGAGNMRGVDSFVYQVSDGFVSVDVTQKVIINQKIMPLGDSITTGEEWLGVGYKIATDGIGKTIGYRQSLYNGLLGAGYTFDFVGSLLHGDNLFPDAQHEGHEGWTAFDIATADSPNFGDAEVQTWLDSNPADIILLHAGTNDFAGTSAADIGNILDKIDAWAVTYNNPITVLLARIIDQYDYTAGAIVDVRTFNDNVASMVAARTGDVINITIVDQRNALLYPDDLSEDLAAQVTFGLPAALHPNAGGYVKMANTWFTALSPVVDKCP